MKTHTTVIATIDIQSLRKQWNQTGPFIPDATMQRDEYATTVLRELGADVAHLVLTGFEEMSPVAIEGIMSRGVNVAGKTMHLAFITQRKGLNAPLPLVDEATAALTRQMFPRVIDVVRMGALLTPMRGGVAVRVPARVLLTTPDDARFQLGDGQGMVAADWMPGHLPKRFKHQFRAVLHGVNNGVDMLAKGTLLSGSEAAMHGYDIVLTKNEVKGGDGSLPLGEHVINVTLGCMHGPDERLSGKTTFGRQFMQHMPDEFFDHPDTDRYVRRVAKTLNKLVEDPVRLAKFCTRHENADKESYVSIASMRNDAGDVDRQRILGFAAAISEALGNNRLMYTGLVREMLADALADKSRNLAVSGGMAARYYMLTADNRLPVGTIQLNDHVLRNQHMNETQVVAGRNPHVEPKGAVAVTLVGSRNVDADYAVANELTMIDAAADNDGDAILVGVGTAPQMAFWHAAQLSMDRSNRTKVRRKGEPPATKHEMIAQVMNINIGAIERCLAKFVAIEKIHGFKVQAYLGNKLASADTREIKAYLCDELQKAVDGIKTGSMPNMKQVSALSGFADQLVDEQDYGYVPLDNGTLPVFRCAPDKLNARQKNMGVNPGEYIIPSNYVNDRTPLGRHMRKVEDLVPCVVFDTVPNAEFAGWIDFIPGEGAQTALASLTEMNNALGRAHALPADLVAEAVSEAIRAFREEWRVHYAEKTAAKNWQWLRSAASQFWTSWTATESRGYALWHSLPEVWATMLLERKAQIAAMPKLSKGALIGKDFREFFVNEEGGVRIDQVHTAKWFDVTVYLKANKKRIKVRGKNGFADNLLRENTSAAPGKYRALISATSKPGTFNVVFHEEGYVLPVVRKPEPVEAAEAEAVPGDDEIAAEAFFDPSAYLDEDIVIEE